jgi:hypothetical protein
MTNHTHGGRRPNQTGRPRHTVQKTVQVKARFAPDEVQRFDLLRKPNESRAACLRRLVMEIIRMKEQTMNRQIVVSEEVLEELIRRWTGAEINLAHEFSGDIKASHKEIDDEEKDMRERLIVGALTAGSMAGEVLLLPYTKE